MQFPPHIFSNSWNSETNSKSFLSFVIIIFFFNHISLLFFYLVSIKFSESFVLVLTKYLCRVTTVIGKIRKNNVQQTEPNRT